MAAQQYINKPVPAHPNLGLSIFMYMIGAFTVFCATPFSLDEERIEKLKSL